jgi:hypothetical protein
MITAAAASGAPVGSRWFDICGVRFELEHRRA